MTMHRCPVRGCKVTNVPDKWLMCPYHWRQVPAELQGDVWTAFGPCGEGVGSVGLLLAQEAAIKAVNERVAS